MARRSMRTTTSGRLESGLREWGMRARVLSRCVFLFFFFQAEDGIRDYKVTGVQTCALPISLQEAEAVYRQLYEVNAPLLRFLSDLRIPLPKSLQLAAEFALNNSLRRALGTQIGRASCRGRE